MQQPAIPNGAQVVVLAEGMPTNTRIRFGNMEKRFARLLIVLGSVHIAIGSLCVIFQCVIFAISASTLMSQGDGTRTGILFIVTGVFGIRGGKKNGKCQVVTFNVLSILSAILAAPLLILNVPLALYNTLLINEKILNYKSSGQEDRLKGVVAMNSLLAVLAILEGVVAIWSSVICCKIGACYDDCGGSCCCPTEPQYNQTSLEQHQSITGDQQRVLLSHNQQQQMCFPYQPMAGVIPQQYTLQYFPHQPNALLIPHQPALSAFSPEATGKGSQSGQCTGMTAAPPSIENVTQQDGKESDERPKYVDDPEMFARAYDDGSEYNY